MNSILKTFISDHINDDIHQLALNAHKYPNIDMNQALVQIKGRKKIKNKVSSFYENDDIIYPIQLSIEQSSSQTTASYKASLCNGNLLVDLTGGFGVDCYFMSENFETVTYVEKNEELCRIAEHNFSISNRHNINVVNTLSETFLQNTTIKADWIFIDPARRDTRGNKLVMLSDCEPDISALAPLLLSKAENVMVKLSPMLDIHVVIEQLPMISEIHIVSTENECKELLIILNHKPHDSILIKTINFQKNHNQRFDFELQDELNSDCNIASDVENSLYLYEANSAVMKAGAFKLIGQKFKIDKLQIHTHLYVSDKLHLDFPGRIFSIKKIWEKETWKTNADVVKKANISTRNFPTSVDEIRKKLKLSDGGDIYLFACTLSDNKKVIIETSKIESQSIIH
jgi:16S rRNA G966 N2-methylase RsmD